MKRQRVTKKRASSAAYRRRTETLEDSRTKRERTRGDALRAALAREAEAVDEALREDTE